MNNSKIVLFGCTKFSKEILDSIIELPNIDVIGIVTSPESFKISYSKSEVKNYNFFDLSVYEKQDRWIYEFDNNSTDAGSNLVDRLSHQSIDLIIVAGWYYMVPKKIRELSQHGAWGLHASLLPKYAGGAPLVWAMINGEKEAGISLFKLSDGVDNGPLIGQKSFEIIESDYISDVLKKMTSTSQQLLFETLSKFPQYKLIEQQQSEIEVWPQRKPEDGELTESLTSTEILRRVKAQSRPYPGAFYFFNNQKVIIWRAQLLNDTFCEDKFVMKCGDGKILEILDFELVEKF